MKINGFYLFLAIAVIAGVVYKDDIEKALEKYSNQAKQKQQTQNISLDEEVVVDEDLEIASNESVIKPEAIVATKKEVVVTSSSNPKEAPVRPFSFQRAQVEAVYGAQVNFVGDVIKLRTRSAEWNCGLRIKPPAGKNSIDLSKAYWLAVDVKNVSPDRQMRLTMHLSSGGAGSDSEDHATAILAKNRSINTGIGLNPGEKGTMKIHLPHPEIYLAPDNAVGPYVIDTSHISMIELKVQWPYEAEFEWVLDCELSNFRLIGEPDLARKVPANKYNPFIDKYGQFIHDDWAKKVKNDSELVQDLVDENAALLPPPSNWDEFGGWAKGPQLRATGHFRTEKYNGKWFFVTPSGHLFYSMGIDVIRNVTDASDGTKHPDWYDMPIPSTKSMPFSDWNIQKKFGKKDYLSDYYDFVIRRLDSWGMNTIGNWSGNEIILKGKKPYVLSLGEREKSVPTIANLKFYDVYDANFEKAMYEVMRVRFETNAAAKKSINDPMCIGYFYDNEMDFANVTARAIAADYDKCAAKRAFFAYAEDKYKSWCVLSKAWGIEIKGKDEFHALKTMPNTAEFKEDRVKFESDWYSKYFSTVRAAIKKYSPNKLYLGSRFVGFRQSGHLWNAAAESCDVVTVNSYANSLFNVSRTIFKDAVADKPMLVGEFHFGAFDRGMFKSSLCPVSDQVERARSFKRFVQGTLCHPNMVGCHWFQYRDQPLIGRGDGEAYPIGFVDTCDRTYDELCNAAREIGESMYEYRIKGVPVN